MVQFFQQNLHNLISIYEPTKTILHRNRQRLPRESSSLYVMHEQLTKTRPNWTVPTTASTRTDCSARVANPERKMELCPAIFPDLTIPPVSQTVESNPRDYTPKTMQCSVQRRIVYEGSQIRAGRSYRKRWKRPRTALRA